jgi:RimJ/RimL family protein N-acetyltransferase
MDARIEKIIEESRKKSIQGKCIDLVPLSMKDISNVVQIRNREKNKYFLSQNYDLTEEGQKKWYESYLDRKNDIYWCIYNKENEFIGTIRIYDIDGENDICDQGSFMIYEEQAEGAPYALEAEILSLDFAFDILGIHNVINEDRSDNKVMNNLTRRLGFEYKKKTVIRDDEYNYYILTPDNYRKNREKFAEMINYWESR